MLCFRGEKYKQMLLWPCLPVGWFTPAPGDPPALRKRAAPTHSTAGFRCWPGHICTVVKGLSLEGVYWGQERVGMAHFVSLCNLIDPGDSMAQDRQCCLVRGWTLQMPLVPLAQCLQNSTRANCRGRSYQADSLTTILKKISHWLHNLELTVCLRHHLIS